MKLNAAGIPTAMYHAGMENEARAKAQEDFIYDNIPVIAATNALAWELTSQRTLRSSLQYTAEPGKLLSGRPAARDVTGLCPECILLYSGQDVMINRFLFFGTQG